MTTTIGSQTNVPDPGSPITSPWAQDTSRKLVHTFANAAARDAWSTRPDGAMAYTIDTDTLWVYRSSDWQKVLAQTTGQWQFDTDLYVRKAAAGLYLQDGSGNQLGHFYANDGPPVTMILSTLAGRGLRHFVGAADRLTILSSGLILIGSKLASDLNAPGLEIDQIGAISSTNTVAHHNIQMIKVGAAAASGQVYAYFKNGGTVCGSITLTAALNAVAYNTTSHGPWKGDVADIDPADAFDRVSRWRPVSFRWKKDADGNVTETGTPSGDPVHGFIAQELAEVEPDAVTEGTGTEADQAAWMQRRDAAAEAGEEFTEPDPFRPWMIDQSALIPTLVAAVQALADRVATLEAAAAT